MLIFGLVTCVQGGSLFRLISKQMANPHSRLYSDEDAFIWLLQIGTALQHLHDFTPIVVHRDIKQVVESCLERLSSSADLHVTKQENIMLTKQDGKLVAKVLDFSLATVIASRPHPCLTVPCPPPQLPRPTSVTRACSWPNV